MRGKHTIVCLSCFSIQGFKMLPNPSGWKMPSNYKFLLLFLLPCKSSDAGFYTPICFCLRRFIQIKFEEKSRLPNHNDRSKNPLNHFGNPNKFRAWRWVAWIVMATKFSVSHFTLHYYNTRNCTSFIITGRSSFMPYTATHWSIKQALNAWRIMNIIWKSNHNMNFKAVSQACIECGII